MVLVSSVVEPVASASMVMMVVEQPSMVQEAAAIELLVATILELDL